MTQQVDAVVSDEVAGGDVIRKKVDELSLDEIKAELERRKLDFSGDDYAILHERLTDSMIEEGLDPGVYEFELEAEEDDEEDDDDSAPTADQIDSRNVNENNNIKTANENSSSKGKESPAVVNNNNNTNNSSSNNSSTASTKKKELPAPKKPTAPVQYKEVPGNHLWVSGLSSRCKAADLKKFFARYANVGSAKIVANARTTSAHCYGYITVESPADLEKCVQKLHSTRFEGSFIRVEICKLAPADQLRKVEMKNRERLAQQKEEFRKRQEERKKKIDEELKRREEQHRRDEEKRKEIEKKREEERKKRREEDVKKDHKKDDRKPPERRRTRSRSPVERRRPEPFRRQEPVRRSAGPPLPRRFNSPAAHRRGSPPYSRGRPRRMSPPSPFNRGAPPPPFVHGPVVMERMPPIDRNRVIERDRRLEEERFEVERRQRAEADALERERRQLRMEEERLEREKLDLIRLERERVKKEMEEVAARKEMAERRRQEELRRQQEEERKREELRLEMERRPREMPRPPMPSPAQAPIELYDPRLPLPVDDYGRGQAEDKFGSRLGPPLQRDQAGGRHDDRRRDERRREPPMSRDDRRPPEQLDPWNSSELKRSSAGDYLDQHPQHAQHPSRHDSQLGPPPKRMRSRSPPPQRSASSNSGYGVLSAADYSMGRGPSGGDPWPPQGSRGQMSSMPSSNFLDSRRPAPPQLQSRTPEVPSGGGQWSTNPARVAFPPAYGHQESSRGLLGSSSGPSASSFGLGALSSSGFRRY